MSTYPQLIRRADLRRMVPLSDSRIWELERQGRFPKRIRLSQNAVAWDLAEVTAWIEARKAEGDTQAAPPPPVEKRKWRAPRGATA
jgi:prophage regulatory protein